MALGLFWSFKTLALHCAKEHTSAIFAHSVTNSSHTLRCGLMVILAYVVQMCLKRNLQIRPSGRPWLTWWTIRGGHLMSVYVNSQMWDQILLRCCNQDQRYPSHLLSLPSCDRLEKAARAMANQRGNHQKEAKASRHESLSFSRMATGNKFAWNINPAIVAWIIAGLPMFAQSHVRTTQENIQHSITNRRDTD